MSDIKVVENNTRTTAAVAVLLFLVAATIGYTWGKIIKKGDNITEVYIFKGKDGAVLKEGFACLCQKPNSTSSWYGIGTDSACKSGNTLIKAAKVLTLQNDWVPDSEKSGVLPPSGACCRVKPSIPGVSLTVPDGVNCYVSLPSGV